MLSLAQLSANKIIHSLPQECLDHLAQSLIKERRYDLTKFILSEKPQNEGWYLVFLESMEGDSYRFLGISSYAPFLTCDYYHTPERLSHAYYLPKSTFNDTIYTKDREITPFSTFYVTIHDVSDYPKSYPTTEIKIKDNRRWKTPFLEKATIKYYIPPNKSSI